MRFTTLSFFILVQEFDTNKLTRFRKATAGQPLSLQQNFISHLILPLTAHSIFHQTREYITHLTSASIQLRSQFHFVFVSKSNETAPFIGGSFDISSEPKLWFIAYGAQTDYKIELIFPIHFLVGFFNGNHIQCQHRCALLFVGWRVSGSFLSPSTYYVCCSRQYHIMV